MSQSGKPVKIAMTGIDDYFRNNCPRSARLDDLYEHIEKMGLNNAWVQYIIKDIEDVIVIDGPEYLMKNLSVTAKEKLLKYIKRHY